MDDHVTGLDVSPYIAAIDKALLEREHRMYRDRRELVIDACKEIRIKDPITGGEKGEKDAQFSLIPPEFTWALAEHYGRGAKKYERDNWLRGYRWSLSYDALQRHIHQWVMGETNDLETGTHHLIAAAWHCCALFIFQLRGLGTDDLRAKDK